MRTLARPGPCTKWGARGGWGGQRPSLYRPLPTPPPQGGLRVGWTRTAVTVPRPCLAETCRHLRKEVMTQVFLSFI